MNIMVFDVPAISGGALSVLDDFYEQVKLEKDTNLKWVFVLSVPELEEANNIRVLRFPWIKKSWIHRLYFDHVVAPKLISKHNIDQVLSLQNITIPHTKIDQIVYVHQSIPFSDYRFSLKNSKKLWVYQKIIGRFISKSIGKANVVVVQTNWMKEIIIEKLGVDNKKIKIIPPRISHSIHKVYNCGEGLGKRFVYPAGAYVYKNHSLIIESCELLKQEGIVNFKVIFTLNGNENRYSKELLRKVKKSDLPIEFVGNLARQELFDLYGNSVLLFPSHVESYGLPLYEARLQGTIILASDYRFSKEVLYGYENAHFFNPHDAEELKILMKKVIMDNVIYNRKSENSTLLSGGWKDFIRAL